MAWGAMARLGAIAIGACALVGCITADYGPIGTKGSPYGYSDIHNADGSYTIRVVAMHATQAHEFWDRRAAEICGSTNFRKNIFRAEIPVVTVSGYASNPYNPGYGGSYTQDQYGNLIMEGYLHCQTDAQAAEAAPASTAAAAETAPNEAPQTQP